MFEDPEEMILRLHESGIRICKVHLGAALKADVGSEGPPQALEMFQDGVYLHQVRVRAADGVAGFPDLPEALADASAPAGEWRVHYHVPLTWAGRQGISTTTDVLSERFFHSALSAGVKHFEVETYTLSVFPDIRGGYENVLAGDIAYVAARLLRCLNRGERLSPEV
jgi:hypothetical protein